MWCGGNQRSVSKKELGSLNFFKSQFIFFYCMWTWVNFISPYYKIGIDVCEFDFPQLRQPTLDIVIYYYIIIIAKCKCAPGLTMKCSFVPLLYSFFVCVSQVPIKRSYKFSNFAPELKTCNLLFWGKLCRVRLLIWYTIMSYNVSRVFRITWNDTEMFVLIQVHNLF